MEESNKKALRIVGQDRGRCPLVLAKIDNRFEISRMHESVLKCSLQNSYQNLKNACLGSETMPTSYG